MPASNTEYIHITNPGLTVTLSGLISGNSNLTRGSDAAGQVNGTLVLNNAGNTFQNFQLQSLGGAVDVQGASTLPAGATGNNITSGPLGTKTITLGSTNSGSIALENSSPVAVTLGNTLQIEDPCSFISASGLTFAGAVTLTGSGQGSSNNHIIDFSVGANSNIAFTGQISGVDGVNLRSGSGVGGLTLSGSSTYTGATSITMGTLILGGNAPAGAAGVLGNASSPVTIGDANSAGNAAALVTNGDYTIARPITVNSTAGPATLGTIATGTSTYSGAIVLDNSAMLSAPAGGSAIFTGPITGTSGITAAAATGGNVSLAATAANQDTYSGATTVASGQLTLDYGLMTPSGGTVGGMLPDSPLVLSGGTLAFKGNAAAAVNETLLSTQVAAPGSAVVVSPVNGQALEIGLGSITRNGGVLDLPVSSATFTTTNPNSNGILGGYLTVNGYQGWAANNGSNTIAALSSYNTDDYSSPGNNVDVTNFALTPSGTVNSLRFNQATGGTLALSGELMLASGGILVTPNVGPHNVAISGGVLTASGTTSTNALADVVVVQGNTAAPFTIGANITNNGTVSIGLTKGGPGELVLTGSNTFTGPISVSAGTLQMGDGTPGHDTVLSGNIANNGTVIVNLNGNQTYGGTISGAGNLVKGGPGTLAVANTSDYGGATTINQGTLQLTGYIRLLSRTHPSLELQRQPDRLGGWRHGHLEWQRNPRRQSVTISGSGSSHVNYVALGNGSNNILPTTNSPYTIELWATENGLQSWSRIFDFGTTAGGPSNLLWSWTQGTNNPSVISPDSVNFNAATFTPGTEYHIALVVTPSGSGCDLNWYQFAGNGTLIASGSDPNNPVPWNISQLTQTNMWLGRSEYGDQDADATYNEVRIWNAALTQVQLTALTTLGPDTVGFNSNVLPTTTPLTIAASGTLDLGGTSQQVASLSDYTLGSGGSIINSNTAAAATLTFQRQRRRDHLQRHDQRRPGAGQRGDERGRHAGPQRLAARLRQLERHLRHAGPRRRQPHGGRHHGHRRDAADQ